ISIQYTGSIASQAACHDKISQVVDCRQCVTRRQRDDLFVAAAEERIVVDKKRTSPLFDKRRKCSVKGAFSAGVKDTTLLPDGASDCLQILPLGLGDRIGRVD